MVAAALLLAWYTVSHLPKAAVVAATPSPESAIIAEVANGALELQPPTSDRVATSRTSPCSRKVPMSKR